MLKVMPEGMGFSVGTALAVLPRAEKEEESHDGQIGDGALLVGGSWEARDSVLEVDKQFERDLVYTGGWGVLFAVSPELTGQAEVGVAELIVAQIFGPHAGEDLGHGAKVLLTGRPLVARWPVRTWWAKSWRRGTGLWTPAREGSSPSPVQKRLHWRQLVWSVVARLEWTPAATSSWQRP
jgi:hypothetical protein